MLLRLANPAGPLEFEGQLQIQGSSNPDRDAATNTNEDDDDDDSEEPDQSNQNVNSRASSESPPKGMGEIPWSFLFHIPAQVSTVSGNPWCNNPNGQHLRMYVTPNQFGYVPGCLLHNDAHSPHDCDEGKHIFLKMANEKTLSRALLTAFFWDRRRKPSLEVRSLLALTRKSRGAVLALEDWSGAQGAATGKTELGLVWSHAFAKNMRTLDMLKSFDYVTNSVAMMPVDGNTCTGSQLLKLDESEFFISEEVKTLGRRPNLRDTGTVVATED